MKRHVLATENLTMAFFSVITMLVCGYFFYAATHGPYGLYEKGRIEADEVLLTQHLQELSRTRAEAENRAHRLSDQYLDLDLLDEQSRKVLGMVRDDEVIVR